MWLNISCRFSFEIPEPTPFVLMLRPRSGLSQWIGREEYIFEPGVPAFEFTDHYGNLCQRLVAPVGQFALRTDADVMTTEYEDQAHGAPFIAVQDLPDSTLIYLLPSRYCESDRFGQLATNITSGCNLGYDQVSAIVKWLQQTIQYIPGSSNYPISAIEVYARQTGVCRDLSHLGIALCRSLAIPARMVVGYLYGLEPIDLHAWFEVYVGGRWYTFDATQATLKGGYVAIGYGRDAADVAVYSQYGPTVYATEQMVSVQQIYRQ